MTPSSGQVWKLQTNKNSEKKKIKNHFNEFSSEIETIIFACLFPT